MKTMKSIVMVFLCLATTGLFAAPIYLKADAPDGGDGTSWSNAYTTIADAVAALNASEDVQPTLYVAKGVYKVSSATPFTVANFTVRGGYRASEDGDMTRDIREYPTVFFQGTAAQLADRTIVRNVPDEGALTVTKVDTMKFFVNGKFVFPEDVGGYTGEQDAYVQNGAYGVAGLQPFAVEAGAGGEISGIFFVGGNRQPQLNIKAGATAMTVEDCGFYFSYAQSTALVASAPTTIRRCSFRFHDIPYGGGVLGTSAGCLVEDCLFSDNIPARYFGQQLVNLSGTGTKMKNCVFRRNIVRYTDTTNCGAIGGVLRANSGTVVEDTAFSNNFITVIGTYNLTLVETAGAHLSRCVFKDNLMRVNPCSGLTYAFAQSTYAAYHNSFDGCTFAGNRIEGVLTPTGDFAMSMIANSVDSSKLAVVNCTFYSNAVSSVDAGLVSAAFSRGVLTRAASTSKSTSQLGLANCTFLGPAVAGVKEVIQIGASHGQPLNVVNCIFQTDAVEPVDPFRFDVPALANIQDCTIKNMLEAYYPAGYDLTPGLETDEIPYAEDGLLYRPAAKTPGIRTSADVGVTAEEIPRPYQYRLASADSWMPLVSTMKAATVADPALIGDAAGETRPAGAMTRGAVQRLAEPAETGVSLTVRVAPLTSGTVSSPATQAVALNEPIAPVTAVAPPGGGFLGWYRENGDLYERNETLEIDSLGSDLVLSAKFAARQVTVIFDLDGKGTFTESGESTQTVVAYAGEAFPPIPAYRLNDGWIVVRTEMPALVPDVAEPVVIRPEIISTSVRSVYVTPTGTGKMDGSDWANAYGSIADAVADAGKYRGEVFLGAGLYVLKGAVVLPSNVALRGGFGGPTVISGDVSGNDVWVGSLNGQDSTQSAIWDYGTLTFFTPNPEASHDYWKPSDNISDNTTIGFTVPAAGVTNVAFSGLVLTGFRCSAVYCEGTCSDVLITNCTVSACGGSLAKDALNVNYRAIHARPAGPFELVDVEFVGNSYAAYLTAPATSGVTTNSVHDCAFVGNNAGCLYVGTATQTVSFVERVQVVSNGVGSMVVLASSCKLGKACLTDSVFRANRFRSGSCAVDIETRTADNSQQANCAYVSRCLFEDNVLNTTGTGTMGVYNGGGNYYNSYVSDCCWRGNVINISGGAQNQCAAVAGRITQYSQIYFYDCTFMDNTINSGDYTVSSARAGILGKDQHYGRMVAVNCSFKGNKFTAGHEANEGEGVIPYSSANWKGLKFINCAVDNADGHRVFAGRTSSYATLRNCTVTSFDIEQTGMDVANVTTNRLTIADPMLKSRADESDDGLASCGVRGESPCRRAAYPIACNATGYLYYYDPSAASPWVSVGDWSSLSVKQAEAAGITLDNLKPDALGRPRKWKKCAQGPLNADPLGLSILVR